jgi:hypothetical protein
VLTPIALALAALAMPSDTVLLLGSRSIDLTGDRIAETLILLGTGPSTDSLGIVLEIRSLGEVLYTASLRPVTRLAGSNDAPARSAAEHIDFLNGFGRGFFDDAGFVSAARFLADLRREAPRRVADIPRVIARHRAVYRDHALGRLEAAPMSTDTTGAGAIWSEMLAQDRIVFRFSPGGGDTTAIAWSNRDRRFYRLLECC